MANHAYVVPRGKGKLPSAEQINKDAQEIVRRKFPQFTLEYQDDSWELFYKGRPDIAMIFWMGEYDPGRGRKPRRCIEFRHGHTHRFMWWVEYEIREELACRYNAWSADDAFGGLTPPKKERYNTYQEYRVSQWLPRSEEDLLGWKNLLDEELKYERVDIPVKLRPLIGGTV